MWHRRNRAAPASIRERDDSFGDSGNMGANTPFMSAERPRFRTHSNSVKFAEVEIHEFSSTLGDNPSCRDGVPIALSWTLIHRSVRSLDDYERERSPNRRRNEQALLILRKDREELILRNHSMKDIYLCQQEIMRIQKQRRETCSTPRVFHLFSRNGSDVRRQAPPPPK